MKEYHNETTLSESCDNSDAEFCHLFTECQTNIQRVQRWLLGLNGLFTRALYVPSCYIKFKYKH